MPHFQSESREWNEINRRLRGHGLAAIKIQHPIDVSPVSDAVCVGLDSSQVIRQNLDSLMNDCDHRQTLIQDLILTNNNLRIDLTKQTKLTDKYHDKAREFKHLLSSSDRLEDFEHSQSVSRNLYESEEQLLNTKKSMHNWCRQLEEQCLSQQKEIEHLKLKLLRMVEEEEKRTQRQGQVFKEFNKRTMRAHSMMDGKLLDVIDAYEKEVHTLKEELEYYKFGIGDDGRLDTDSVLSSQVEPSQNMKSLIKSYDKQLAEAKKTIKKLQEQEELTKLDADSRPQLTDYRVAQLRIKKLERLLALHNISIPGDKKTKDPYRMKKVSTNVDDLDYLPLSNCKHYLKEITSEMDVTDLENIIPSIIKIKDSHVGDNRYEKLGLSVYNIVKKMENRDNPERMKRLSAKQKHLSERSLQHIVNVIDNWREDMERIQELQNAVNKIGERVAPWMKLRLSGEATLAEILDVIDRIVTDDGAYREQDGKEHPSRTVLENIVQHFQTLFDVPTISGIYPRMNDIYKKLGEVHNVMKTLKSMLGLAEDAKSSIVIDTIAKLCNSHQSTTSQQLRQLLQTDDIDGVIRRLDEHTRFFPVFHEVIKALMDVLGVHRIDEVIPAVRALKVIAS